MRRGPFSPFLASAVLAALLVPSAAQAQYFGRNQVRYRDFDFQVLKTDHFDIYYYPEEREAIERTAPMAERWYARLSRLLGHTFASRQPLILYGSHPEFEQTNVLGGAPGESTGGVTEALKRRVVLPFAGPLAETDHVLGHELVHAFQFDITGDDGAGGLPGALRLPLWFIEGMAEYLSVGPVDPHTAMWMRDAAKREKLPTISQLGNPRYFPYRYGQALWAYVGGRYGDHVVGDILKIAGKRGDAETAMEEVLGIKIDDLSKDWHKALQDAYQPLMASKHPASDYGRALITDEKGGGELNIGPKLSPDGRQIVFLSERGLFAIEMYLADAHTGEVKRAIVKTAVDPHFESLQFLNSAGAWDAAGRRFVFGAIHAGRPVLSILDVARGEKEREVPLRDLGEVHSPTWSPDGRYVAFSAITGGLTDLYIYDLQAGTLRKMTSDAFADLQPAWSPDGRSIAFVTDRFSSPVEVAEGGAYRLAVLDPGVGRDPGAPQLRGGQEHRPPVVRRLAEPLFPLRPQRDHERVPPGDRERRALPGDRPPDRRQRHHRLEPGPERRRLAPGLQRLRGRQVLDLRHGRRAGHGGHPGGRGRRPDRGGHAPAARAQVRGGPLPAQRPRFRAAPAADLRHRPLQGLAAAGLRRPAHAWPWAPIPSGRTWAAACPCSSATCSATTRWAGRSR